MLQRSWYVRAGKPLIVLASVVLLVAVAPAVGVEAAAPHDQPLQARACSAVEHQGVRFELDGAHWCGSFANGDPWLVPAQAGGSVEVQSVHPAATPGRSGMMVNPSGRSQGYDDRVGGFSPSSAISVPFRARGGQSLVKSVSAPDPCGGGRGHPSCLQSAVVLTVLHEVPAGGGATTFRPPYFGEFKPLLSTNSLRWDLLPSLPAVPTAPPLEWVRARFAKVQLDHLSTWQGRYLHPVDSFTVPGSGEVSNYGSDLGRDNNDAVLRLMLDNQPEQKLPALVNVVQAGIDWYGNVRGGVVYGADGGHSVGRKVMVTLAGVLLDDRDIKRVAGQDAYSENGHVYFSDRADRSLFGKECPEGMYDAVRTGGSGSRDCRDPAGEIDGGERPGGYYQVCCTAKSYKASSLAVRLLPGGRAVWDHDALHDYVDRWVDHGTWTLPDARTRFPELHGTGADSGQYGSSFQDAMWRAHPSGATDSAGGGPAVPQEAGAPSGGPATTGTGEVSGAIPPPPHATIGDPAPWRVVPCPFTPDDAAEITLCAARSLESTNAGGQ